MPRFSFSPLNRVLYVGVFSWCTNNSCYATFNNNLSLLAGFPKQRIICVPFVPNVAKYLAHDAKNSCQHQPWWSPARRNCRDLLLPNRIHIKQEMSVCVEPNSYYVSLSATTLSWMVLVRGEFDYFHDTDIKWRKVN